MKKKRVFWGFLSTDYKAMEEYLQGMARKGWMLEKAGQMMARFRRIPPQELTFYVDVFKDEGPLVPENTKDSQEYRRICEESGWHFITSQDYLQFFYAQEGQHPTPIQTDGELEFWLVRNFLLKREFLSIALMIFILRDSIYRLLFNPYFYFLSPLSMMGGMGVLLLLLNMLGMAGYFLLWMLQAKKRMKRGLGIKVPSLKEARGRTFLFSGVQILSILLIFLALSEEAPSMPSDIIVLVLIVMMIALGIGTLIRFLIKKRGKTKEDGFAYFSASLILLILFLPPMLNVFLGSIVEEPTYDAITIPQGYPMVSMEEFLGKDYQREVIWWEFQPRSSPLVPMSYDLYGSDVCISYYQSTHPWTSRAVFDGKVKELQKFLNYFHHSPIEDEDLKEKWNVDELILSQNRDTMILREGLYVLYLEGRLLDFEQEELIRSIREEYFQYQR